jgi:DNA polymerase-3 subunit delta
VIIGMNNLLLLYGDELLLIKEEINKIKSKIVPDYLESVNFIPLDGRTAGEEEIIDACNTVPLITNKKMVLVNDAQFFNVGKNSDGRANKDSLLIDYLEELPPHVFLVFTCAKVDKRRKLFKVIQKIGVVCEYSSLKIKNKTGWIRDRAKRYGKKIEYTAATFLSQFTNDLYNADLELKKLVHFSGDRDNITMDDILMIFSGLTEHSIFEMTDYIGMKKGEQAIKILDGLTSKGESCIKILFMISKHLTDILAIKTRENMSFKEIRNQLALHPFVLKKAIEHSKNFNVEELKKALKMCQDLDIDIKKGRVTDKMGLEILLAKISG